MRNLQNVLFLSLLGVTLSTGCTVTTSNNLGQDGDGGDSGNTDTSNAGTTASGGGSATGGATTTVVTGTGGSTTAATGGASSTTPVFSTADCATTGATVPASAPDVTAACIACVYDASKTCTQAVACHNDPTCVPEVLAALECIELYFQFGGDIPISEDERAACQNGDLIGTQPPTGSETMTIKSTSPTSAWQGSNVASNAGMTLISDLITSCATECHATVAPAS